MNSLSRILHRGGSRGLLLGVVGLLVLVKAGLWLQETYQADRAELESRQASLVRSRKLTGKLPELRSQLQGLNGERERLAKFLFTGANEENIISAMQLDIQALVSTAGLEAETIRPLKQKNAQVSGDESVLGEVAIKASLSGTLAEYQTFLAELYRSPKVYKIEAVTLTPFKKSELKILIDLRGYFVITAPELAVAPEGGGTAPAAPLSPAAKPTLAAPVAPAAPGGAPVVKLPPGTPANMATLATPAMPSALPIPPTHPVKEPGL